MGHQYLAIAPPCLNLWLVASSPTLSSLMAYADKTSEVLIHSALYTATLHNFNFFRHFFPYTFHN